MRPEKAGTTACWSQQHPQLQFVKGDRREEQAAVPCQSAPCATPQQGWYQSDPSEEISRPGRLPVVRQGEIEILHAGHGEQIDSSTWAGRPRSVMNTGLWLAARLAHGHLGFSSAFGTRTGIGRCAGGPIGARWSRPGATPAARGGPGGKPLMTPLLVVVEHAHPARQRSLHPWAVG